MRIPRERNRSTHPLALLVYLYPFQVLNLRHFLDDQINDYDYYNLLLIVHAEALKFCLFMTVKSIFVCTIF